MPLQSKRAFISQTLIAIFFKSLYPTACWQPHGSFSNMSKWEYILKQPYSSEPLELQVYKWSILLLTTGVLMNCGKSRISDCSNCCWFLQPRGKWDREIVITYFELQIEISQQLLDRLLITLKNVSLKGISF